PPPARSNPPDPGSRSSKSGDRELPRSLRQPSSRSAHCKPRPLLMQRTIQPELLDSLPPAHPDALHNRRDLRLTTRVMGNHRWIAKSRPTPLRPTDRILELGAGTGELAALLESRGLAVDAIDLWPRPKSF